MHIKSRAACSGCVQLDVFAAEQFEHEEEAENLETNSCLSQVVLKSTLVSCIVH